MFTEHAHLVPCVGLIGDSLTVLGGGILSWDAIHEFGQRKIVNVAKAEELKNIKKKIKGVVLKDAESVELAYVKRSSLRALLGTIVLGLGFIALLGARLLEIGWL